MLHEEIIGRLSEYRSGSLGREERTRVRRHLQTCAHCRTLYQGWPDGRPSPGFAGRVMGRLEEGNGLSLRAPGRWWVPLTGTAVAAVLIIAAFWHPERSWLKADRYFGLWNSQQARSNSPAQGWGGEGGAL